MKHLKKEVLKTIASKEADVIKSTSSEAVHQKLTSSRFWRSSEAGRLKNFKCCSNDDWIMPIDESIISIFNIIFESVLFIFDSVLFNIISFLELFYFNCKLFNFRNKYCKDRVLEQKKGIWSWFGLKIRRSSTKIWHPPSQRLGTARATSQMVVTAFRIHFAAFCFMDKLPISLLLT